MKCLFRTPRLLVLLAWLSTLSTAGVMTAQTNSPAGSDTEEVKSEDVQPTFTLQVQKNLVVVRAVVKDSKGRAIGNLHKEDFKLYDRGKLQEISQFGTEVPFLKRLQPLEGGEATADEEAQPETKLAATTPGRYMALYFDDMYSPWEDLARTRDAADKYLATSLQPGDRAGVFTASGQGNLDFTSDLGALHTALLHLRQHPNLLLRPDDCPMINPHQAYQIMAHKDQDALDIAAEEIVACRYDNDQRYLNSATMEARGYAEQLYQSFLSETETTLRGIGQVVRRMSILPGERSIILISSGFFGEDEEIYPLLDSLTSAAIREKVVIAGLDARGLYTSIPGIDASHRLFPLTSRADLDGKRQQLQLEWDSIRTDPVRWLAVDTGGKFANNSNDLDQGLREVGTLPEFYYVLAFSPSVLKYDGAFHEIKVRVEGHKGYVIQARHGYYAPRKAADPAEEEKEELHEALFSQDELAQVPIAVHTQFFKADAMRAKLAVVTRLDVSGLHLDKAEGRNVGDVTFLTAIFDRDGKLVNGKEKKLQLRLLDSSLTRILASGLTVRASFDVPPGNYLVREVVRDGAGSHIAETSRTVEIPY